jgi:hypothetical protein
MADLDTKLLFNDRHGISQDATLADMLADDPRAVRTLLGIGLPRHLLVVGDEDGDIAVAGILVGDTLEEVVYYVGAGVAVTDVEDLTSEFAISANGTINNAGGTDTTGGKLMVRWSKNTA